MKKVGKIQAKEQQEAPYSSSGKNKKQIADFNYFRSLRATHEYLLRLKSWICYVKLHAVTKLYFLYFMCV